MSEMSFDDAVQALENAVKSDAESGTNPFSSDAEPTFTPSSKPAEPSTPQGSVEPPATTEPAPPAAPADSEPSFMERADLDSLLSGVEDPGARERIESAYKSFQKGFTQARQRESEIVRQYEQLGNADELAQLAQLRQSLQNPANLMQLYSELGDHLSAAGYMTPPVSPEIAEPAKPEFPDLGQLEDPDMEPLKQAFGSLRSELDQLRADREAERQAMEAQRLNDAILGELQRQENMIRQSHPNYTQEDIDAVYELSSFHDGNLLRAQQRLEEIVNTRIERYLAGKAAAVEANSPAPRVIESPVPTPEERPQTLEDGHKAAMEALRYLEAQDS